LEWVGILRIKIGDKGDFLSFLPKERRSNVPWYLAKGKDLWEIFNNLGDFHSPKGHPVYPICWFSMGEWANVIVTPCFLGDTGSLLSPEGPGGQTMDGFTRGKCYTREQVASLFFF